MEISTDILNAADVILSGAKEGRVCCLHNGVNMLRPLTKEPIGKAARLLGMKWLKSGRQGEHNWLLSDDWEARLERAGVHPQTLRIIDQEKWKIQLLKFDHEDRERRERQKKRITRAELKEMRESESKGRTRSGSGRSLADQMKVPDEEEVDPSSIKGQLQSQHRRSDRISMRDW